TRPIDSSTLVGPTMRGPRRTRRLMPSDRSEPSFDDPAQFLDDPAQFLGDPELSVPSIIAAQRGLVRLIERMESLVVGQRTLLERLVIALLAGGHVLIEGVPGLAKTRAVRALAQALDLPFRRIQFTPDLLPADLTGTQIYRPA